MIRYADIVDNSVVDGTGIRVTVFLQGCTHNCEGCHNPDLQEPSGGLEIAEEKLADLILKKITPLHKGISISGGDPLFQAEALEKLLTIIRGKKPDLDIWVYTGFAFEEIRDLPVMRLIEVLVDGPFILSRKDLGLAFRGSANQRLIDVPESLNKGTVLEIETD